MLFILPGIIQVDGRILQARIFGSGDILYQLLAEMKTQCEYISRNKKNLIGRLINWNCFDHLQVVHGLMTALSVSQYKPPVLPEVADIIIRSGPLSWL